MIWTRKHLLDIESLSVEELATLLDTAMAFKSVGERAIKKVPALRGKTVVNLFVEPSTRTRISFELSEQRLSADIIDFTAEASSLKKGETLKDTARTLEALNADFIVIRQIIVNNVRKIVNIQTARSHIRCDKKLQLLHPEPVHDVIALGLRKISVQGVGVVAVCHELVRNFLGDLPGAAKHDPVDVRVDIGNTFQRRVAVFRLHRVVFMPDIFRALVHFPDGYLLRAVHVFPGDGCDLIGHRR